MVTGINNLKKLQACYKDYDRLNGSNRHYNVYNVYKYHIGDQYWYIRKDKPIMKITKNNCRIKSPDYNITKLPTVGVYQNEIQNDGISLNPKGRDILDNKYTRANKKVLKCRKILNIYVMNVDNMIRNNINILGIIDHKINHADNIRYKNFFNLTIINSLELRNSKNSSVGGIGIMEDRSLENVISEIKNGMNVY